MKNKYKHMDYIQSAISRMASNSFYLKGWNVTIIAAIVALSFKESDWRIYACALVLNVVFWFLDAYYLMQEKLFRERWCHTRPCYHVWRRWQGERSDRSFQWCCGIFLFIQFRSALVYGTSG